jgi:hypothetical protein
MCALNLIAIDECKLQLPIRYCSASSIKKKWKSSGYSFGNAKTVEEKMRQQY